jgi:hypothetical protein
VESVENRKAGFPRFPPPLGNLAKGGRDSHIPTAPATRRMEKWKTKNRFSTFPPPSSLSLKKKTTARGGLRPPRAGCRPRAGLLVQKTPNKRQTNAKQRRNSRQQSVVHERAVSGSSTIRNTIRFQAHLVLETNSDFRLIFGLENALPATQSPQEAPWRAPSFTRACAVPCVNDRLNS